MSTNENNLGGRLPDFGSVFIAPNEAFEAPIMPVTIDGLTTQVSIKDYFNAMAGNRRVIPLKGGTHSLGLFDTADELGEFEQYKALAESSGFVNGGIDFTLIDANVYYLLSSQTNRWKFMDESPLNKEPILEVMVEEITN